MDTIIKCYNCKKIIKNINAVEIKTDTQDRIGENVFLCNACSEHRCLLCGVVLSNSRVCHKCKEKHGAYSIEHPDFCLKCFNLNSELIQKYEGTT